jgi:hypothetical protein
LVAVCRILFERFLDDDPQRQRHVLRQRFRIVVNDGADDVEIGRAGERPPTGQRFI